MKHILFLLALTILVSCESSENKIRTCTMNDQTVDCKTMDNINGEASTNKILSIKTASEIRLTDNEFEILTNTNEVKTWQGNGEVHTCETNTVAGEIYYYNVDGNTLTLVLDDYEMTFSRQGSGLGLAGSWTAINVQDGMTYATVLTFNQEEIKIAVKCSFN